MSTEERNLLDRYKSLLEQKLGWGSSSGWNNQEFEDLSDKIFDATKTKLSVSTLKRISGKIKYEGSFNKSTLNALAQYIGFENWNSFAYSGFQRDSVTIAESSPVIQAAGVNRAKSALKLKIVFTSVIIGLVILFLIYKNYSYNLSTETPASVKFVSRKITDNLPNSVVFNYDVSKIDADSFFIQQNWDPQRRQKISPKNHTLTSIYYYPGHFNARLIANEKVLKKSRVFIKTKGWKGIIEQEPVPIYLSNEEIKKTGAIGISKETLKEKTGLNVFNSVNTWFLNVRSFNGLNADNFQFEGTLRNTSAVNVSLCRRIYIFILFNGGAFTIPLADRGCISSLYLTTGQRTIDGKENDLSKFGCDFKEDQKVECRVQNKVMTIVLNGKRIFQESVAENLAELVGIKISFEGTGEIKNVRLGAPGKFPVLNDQFN
ncbi:hypothetical protein [Daejeonella sp.]|uniref:hypothetical protein n=1 Tax=Daejeonella sp. TaxID=2805397 RepID=UPI0030BC6603